MAGSTSRARCSSASRQSGARAPTSSSRTTRARRPGRWPDVMIQPQRVTNLTRRASLGRPSPGRWVTRAIFGLALTASILTGVLAGQPAAPFDLLITNARIIDGTGGPSITGSVAVRAGRIAGAGRISGAAARTIDAGGKVVAPGFIDAHSHSD